MYSVVDDPSDSMSMTSNNLRKFGRKRINSELSEPLTNTSIVDEELGSGDPYFVFRKDLHRKLELVDEALADLLRIVHETVRTFWKYAEDVSVVFCSCLFHSSSSTINSLRLIFLEFSLGHGREYSRIQRCEETAEAAYKEC